MINSFRTFIKFMLNKTTKKRELVVLMFLMMLMSLFSLLTATLSKNIVNNVFISLDITFLYSTIIIIIPLYLFNSVVSILYTYLNAKFYTRFSNNVKLDFFDRLQRAPYNYLCRLGPNDAFYRLFQDTSVMTGYFYSIMITMPVSVFSVCAISFVLFRWSSVLTAYILFFTIVQISITLLFRRPVRKSFSSLRTKEQDIATDIGTHFQIIDSIKIFGLEDYSCKEFKQKYSVLNEVVKKNSVLTSLYSTIISLLNQFWLLGLIFFGAKLSSTQQLTVGTFMGIFMLSSSLYTPLSSIIETLLRFEETRVSFNRYLEYYTVYRDEEYGGNTPFIIEHRLVFSNLNFSYDYENNIISNFSFVFPKSAFVLIKGESGSGKTTFAKLLSRLLTPSSGKIIVDHNDLADFEYSSLRTGICFLTQKSVLISDTVLKNIFLSGNIDNEVFWKTIESVGLTETIKRLPQKENTLLGYKGVELSEGEKQRLSLARTLIHRPSILILDEPTSALDEKNKLLISQTLIRYQSITNCLMFVISHDSIFDGTEDFTMSFQQGRVLVQKREH